ncbi:MAG: PKD domain-containing protein [Minisyncoccota bacterium]
MKQAMFAAVIVLTPFFAQAGVAQFVFTTTAQSVAPSVATEQITLEAQDASGQPVSGSTICIRLTSSSGSGQFSTNTSWGDPLSALTLTLSSNQSRRNFYYRDASSGSHILLAEAAPRPDGGTCTQWSPEGGVSWTARHTVSVSESSQTVEQNNTATTTSSENQTTSTVPTQNTPVSSYVAPPEPTLFADAGSDRVVIVGAHTEYVARAYNRKKESVGNASFRWNFGDGTTATGPSVLHHFEYPGRYVVVASISQDTESVSDRIIVTAEPAQLGFFVEQDGSVRIDNNAGRDLDLSRWVVRAFYREFLLPNDSIILKGSSMRISSKTIGFFAGPETELAYPNGALALKSNQASKTETVSPPSPAPAPIVRTRTSVSQKATLSPAEHVELDAGPVFEPAATSQVAAAAAVTLGGYWWLGALVLAGITGAGAIVTRRMRRKEWDVIEDSQ